jgi:Fe2+ transport system protein FeoA
VLPFNHTITVVVDDHPVTLGNVSAKYIYVERNPAK